MAAVFDRITVLTRDITTVKLDAIVIPTNATFERGLLMRHACEAAGPQLILESQKLIRGQVGETRIVPGYRLPAKNVFFTVAPIWKDGQSGEEALLALCYVSCLRLAAESRCKSVGFSAISCGANNFPFKRAIAIAVREVASFLSQNPGLHVSFICFDIMFPNASQWYLEEITKQRRAGLGSASGNDQALVPRNVNLVLGDITKLNTDAIVNAANNSLLGGGGVDGAIHRAAGHGLFAECMKLNGCPTGEARITKGYRLPAKYVIHTVGPIWTGGSSNEDALLRNCYISSLELATKRKCQSIAFPAISCGAYGFPFARATEIAIDAVTSFNTEHESNIQIIFCCFSRNDLEYYRAAMQLAK